MDTTKNEEQMRLVQFNTRVPRKLKNIVKRICKRAKIPVEHVMADALCYYFGNAEHPILNARRTIVMHTTRNMEEDWIEGFKP